MVTNVLEIASVLYARVEGEIIHEGEILENNIPEFATSPDISVSSLISNKGNMHELATITIKATNAFTGETIISTDSGEGVYTELIMPDSQRFVSKDLDGLPMAGIINLQQSIYYDGETSIVEKNVIICPIWLMVLFALTIAAIVVSIVMSIRRHKKKRAKANDMF